MKGRLVFTGTLEGPAIGQTTALVSARCSDVASNPPGTFPDVFHSELVFDGLVDGKRAHANVRYVGRSEPGGHIVARLLLPMVSRADWPSTPSWPWAGSITDRSSSNELIAPAA